MRAGKHQVSFQVNHGGDSPNYAVTCGIMRPTTKDISFINISGLDSCNPASDDLSRFSLKDYEMYTVIMLIVVCLTLIWELG